MLPSQSRKQSLKYSEIGEKNYMMKHCIYKQMEDIIQKEVTEHRNS